MKIMVTRKFVVAKTSVLNTLFATEISGLHSYRYLGPVRRCHVNELCLTGPDYHFTSANSVIPGLAHYNTRFLYKSVLYIWPRELLCNNYFVQRIIMSEP